ncbi:RNA polymerase sigma factor SigB [Streptomyces hygroscopicus subsp. limoneus]|nr:RNA polymerase sigma factor SigB [Streptomyces hygroscopicus subsp. limoneus]
MTVDTSVAGARRRPEPVEPGDASDLLGQYLNEIGSTPLLGAEEEVGLATRIEAGVYADHLLREAEADGRELPADRRRDLQAVARDGQHAKDHMIRANLRLVVAMARKSGSRRGPPFLDVLQEGNLGLIRAVDGFDYTKGYRFSTYATWWIRQAIERGLARHARTVRLPLHVVEELGKLGRVERRLQLVLVREPTVEEVAAESGFPSDRVTRLRRVGRQASNLDTPVGEEGDTVIGDVIVDTGVLQAPEVAEYRALAEQLKATMDTLPPQEGMVLTLRYGFHNGRPRTVRQTAEQVGLTPARVRQLDREAGPGAAAGPGTPPPAGRVGGLTGGRRGVEYALMHPAGDRRSRLLRIGHDRSPGCGLRGRDGHPGSSAPCPGTQTAPGSASSAPARGRGGPAHWSAEHSKERHQARRSSPSAPPGTGREDSTRSMWVRRGRPRRCHSRCCPSSPRLPSRSVSNSPVDCSRTGPPPPSIYST